MFLAALRSITKRFIHAKTIPTNVDANVGMKYKLLKDVVDGRSKIKIGDTFWTVAINEELKSGAVVEITGMEGNKYIVQKEKKI